MIGNVLQHLINSFWGNHLSLGDYSQIPKGEFLIHPGAIWWHLHVPAHTQILEPIFFTISSKAYLEQTENFYLIINSSRKYTFTSNSYTHSRELIGWGLGFTYVEHLNARISYNASYMNQLKCRNLYCVYLMFFRGHIYDLQKSSHKLYCRFQLVAIYYYKN